MKTPNNFNEDFSKPKVIYPETTQGAYFAYDKDEYYIDKTCFMLLSKDARYIQQTLSSSLFEFAYKRIFASVELGQHGYQYNKHALIKLPVHKINDAIKIHLQNTSPKCISKMHLLMITYICYTTLMS